MRSGLKGFHQVQVRDAEWAHSRSCVISLLPLFAIVGWGLTAQAGDNALPHTFRLDPFYCRSDFPVTGRWYILPELMDLKDDIETTLEITVPETQIELNLFAERRNYINYVSQRVGVGQVRRALYVKGSDYGQLYAYRSRSYDVDLRHECTHAWIHNALRFIPLWLDEGLAEYFEVEPSNRSTPLRLSKLRVTSHFGWRPSLQALEAKTDIREMDARDYQDAWAWVHFLLHESSQSRQVLVSYLQAIQQEDPPGPLSTYLDNRIDKANQRLVQHFKQLSLSL